MTGYPSLQARRCHSLVATVQVRRVARGSAEAVDGGGARGDCGGSRAGLTLATSLDVYFADPHSPWQRPTNEKTNGIIRRYLPKGTEITDHQPYLTAIAEEINNQPRRCLGYRTPQEAFQRALTEGVASTS